MKFKITFFQLVSISILFCCFYLMGCGDDSTSPATKTYPNIQMKSGAVYTYNNDTISQDGTYHGTTLLTNDVFQPNDTSFNGKSCFPVNSITKDTLSHQQIRSAYDYYSYNQTEGKFYQYGARRIIDSSQAKTWDLVADFTQSSGTEISLYTLTNLFGKGLTANVYSKVASDTVLTTIGSLVTINCYRVTLRADIQLGGSSVGNVYIDYYIGYNTATNTSNPCGRVRTKIYPVNLSGVLKYPGADQMINRFTLP